MEHPIFVSTPDSIVRDWNPPGDMFTIVGSIGRDFPDHQGVHCNVTIKEIQFIIWKCDLRE